MVAGAATKAGDGAAGGEAAGAEVAAAANQGCRAALRRTTANVKWQLVDIRPSKVTLQGHYGVLQRSRNSRRAAITLTEGGGGRGGLGGGGCS